MTAFAESACRPGRVRNPCDAVGFPEVMWREEDPDG